MDVPAVRAPRFGGVTPRPTGLRAWLILERTVASTELRGWCCEAYRVGCQERVLRERRSR